jgi:hypothetical protein
MTIDTCWTAVNNAVATGTSAVLKFTKLPENPPTRFPCVITQWIRSVPSTEVFQASSGFRSNRKRRSHTFSVQVLVGMTGKTGDEDKDARAKADALMTAINGDTSLGGIAVDAVVAEVLPASFEWANALMYGIGAQVVVTEEV